MRVRDDHDASWLLAVSRGDARADLGIRGARVLSVDTREWLEADVLVAGGRIAAVVPRAEGDDGSGDGDLDAVRIHQAPGQWLTPGFIDAHVHVESSKVTVDRFAETVVPRGTTCIVAEPHEIANVLGVDGVRWFVDSCDGLPLDMFFMVPSCVPASRFESAGASLGLEQMRELLEHPRALGVGELMDFPGVVAGDPAQLAKVTLEGSTHADGHAPGLTGRKLDAYAAAGIASDHECTTVEEAIERRRRGMWVFLREASNARNLRDLLPAVQRLGTDGFALCTDDREPQDLVRDGHIDHLLRLCVAAGLSPIDALILATCNPARAHHLHDHGRITPGARANLLLLPDLEQFRPDHVWVGGALVASASELRVPATSWAPARVRDTMHVAPLARGSLRVPAPEGDDAPVLARVVGALDGQIRTGHNCAWLPVRDGWVDPDPDLDVVSLAVVERHHATGAVGCGFVHGFGLRDGAFASTVAHDAHNIVVAGTNERDMLACVERLSGIGGGIAVARGGRVTGELALPVAGLMSDRATARVADALDGLQRQLQGLGVRGEAPFMMLGFLALSVIPELKLTDQGYVHVTRFEHVPVLVEAAGHPAGAELTGAR